MLRSLRCFVVVLLGAAVAPPAAAQTATSGSGQDRVLREVLEELRSLRRVLEATSLAAVRANVLLSRRQGYQERVDRIERQLADARSDARDSESQLSMIGDELARAEEALSLESDPAKRPDREEQVRQLAAARAQVKGREENRRERELELSAMLTQEQAKLDEAQRGLDRIERELESLQQSSRPGNE
jgi:hypothetical protein